MTTLDYQKYYNLENYLRQTVHDTFHKNGFIDASDFFCIVIWKANRAKSKIANKLSKIEPDLSLCCKQLTQRLFQSRSHKDRLKLLIKNYEFRLPMSSAILSIFYPNDFSVYDVRVCETLPQFSNLVYTTNFENIWISYSNYIKAVKDFHPTEMSLVDKDHLMWGKSFYDQLQNDISSNFK